jgi:transcriptional regulator with XRE-family HTH domain
MGSTTIRSPGRSPAAWDDQGPGSSLREWRQRALLSQEGLAERSGVSVGTIAGLESGRTRHPRGATLRLLADALGLTAEHRAALAAGARRSDRSAGPRSGPAVMAQLPPRLPGIAGRDAEVQRLEQLLGGAGAGRPAPTIVLVTGVAGIGKSALAVHVAHQVAAAFPDGQLHAELHGSSSGADPSAILRDFLHALGVPDEHVPDGLAARAGLYRSLVARRRLLVLLDDARDADQVRPLLPGGAGCAVLVTGRGRLVELVADSGAHPVVLGPLTPTGGRDLLAQRLGRDRLRAEPRMVHEIVDRCAGLPLALAVVAAHAAVRPGTPLRALTADLAPPGVVRRRAEGIRPAAGAG